VIKKATNSPQVQTSAIAQRSDSGIAPEGWSGCRLNPWSRFVGSIHLKKTLDPTSSKPLARPHQTESISTSSGSRRRGGANSGAHADEDMLRSAVLPVLTRRVLRESLKHAGHGVRRASDRLSGSAGADWQRPGFGGEIHLTILAFLVSRRKGNSCFLFFGKRFTRLVSLRPRPKRDVGRFGSEGISGGMER
jgi:hypothetical protein